MGMVEKLPFIRDRLLGCYLFALSLTFKPQFGYGREVLTRCTQMITTIDDMYDIYGTVEELELFTESVERFVSFLLFIYLLYITFLICRNRSNISHVILIKIQNNPTPTNFSPQACMCCIRFRLRLGWSANPNPSQAMAMLRNFISKLDQVRIKSVGLMQDQRLIKQLNEDIQNKIAILPMFQYLLLQLNRLGLHKHLPNNPNILYFTQPISIFSLTTISNC